MGETAQEYVARLVENGRAAQAKIEYESQERVDDIVARVARAGPY